MPFMQSKSLIAGGAVLIVVGAGLIWAYAERQEPVVTQTPGTFNSSNDGLSFTYPTTYKLEGRTDGFEGKTIKVFTLIDKNVVIPDMSEGPPVISILIIPNPENLPLDEWIRTKSISNWQLSNKGEMGASTVGDESGLGYTYSGLYQNTAIGVAHNNKIYLFSVGTLEASDTIKADYFKILDTVKFK